MWLEWRVPACHPERLLVILSEAKNLGAQREILRFAQDDTGEPIRLFLSDELMVQSVGINEFIVPLRIIWKDIALVAIQVTPP
jgi:hypothetical protein